MRIFKQAVHGTVNWAFWGGTFNPYDEPHDISLSALGHDVLNRAHTAVKEWTVKRGITSFGAWTSTAGENPEASQARSPSCSDAPASSSSAPATKQAGSSKAAQAVAPGKVVQKKPGVPRGRKSSQHASQAQASGGKKATQRDVGDLISVQRSDHSAAAGRLIRAEMGVSFCDRKERQVAALAKAVAMCEKGQQVDANFRAELQACGVHKSTIDAIGGPVQARTVKEDKRNVDKLVARIQGFAKPKLATSTMKLTTQQAHKPSGQASSSAEHEVDRKGDDDNDEELDSRWDCTDEYMAATLHPKDSTTGVEPPKLAQQEQGPCHAQCCQAAKEAWEAAHVKLWEEEEALFLAAKVFIMANPNNYDDTIINKYLLFRQRASKEAYKLDLHTPQALRDAGRCMTAQQASSAASVWLHILYQHMVSLIPDQEVTVVTGRGLTTGCRQFVAVGVTLAILQTQGVVKRFWPVSKCGAYRLVLGVPM